MGKKRIVVKIGSSSLTNVKGEIDHDKLRDHVHALATLHQKNFDVILVSSGAVASGFKKLGYPSRPVTIKGKQAAAAVGQGLLIQSYHEAFQKYNITPAQILLTRSDFTDRKSYTNAFSTLSELLERRIIPIINENDTVATEELTFGDNDMLSALVSGFIHADYLIILTDVNGIYDDNPVLNPHAKRYEYLEDITDEMIERTAPNGSKFGTGGMQSKLLAARKAITLNVPVFIGKGNGANKLLNILEGKGDGTYVGLKYTKSINTKKQWIGFHSTIHGKLYIDKGAEEAILFHGKSLLPAGVFKVQGSFEKGDVVEVYGLDGLLGRGEVNFSSKDLEQIVSQKFAKSKGYEEVIHRDRWVEMTENKL